MVGKKRENTILPIEKLRYLEENFYKVVSMRFTLKTDKKKKKKFLLGNYPVIHLIIQLKRNCKDGFNTTLWMLLGGKETPSPKTASAFPLLSFNFTPKSPESQPSPFQPIFHGAKPPPGYTGRSSRESGGWLKQLTTSGRLQSWLFSVFMPVQHVLSTSKLEHPDAALEPRSDGACVGGCLAQQAGLFKAHLG